MGKISLKKRLAPERCLQETDDIEEWVRCCLILGADEGHSVADLSTILCLSEEKVNKHLGQKDEKTKIEDRPKQNKKRINFLDKTPGVCLMNHPYLRRQFFALFY